MCILRWIENGEERTLANRNREEAADFAQSLPYHAHSVTIDDKPFLAAMFALPSNA